ncbi:MAG: NADH-quinone oxidoreductase subunit F [Gammaproteobacteria bacterium]|nr:NADH-quinone oxidoreductase subunit F [Gammaproteobacteria bacterium]
MMTKLCTETFGLSNPASIETYIKCEGYKAWRNIVSNNTSKSEIINKIKNSGLRGKGGAGFLTGLKWSFIPLQSGQKYLVCNSDESEPGTCKDRDILRYNPHAVIEGMLIASYAIGASVAYNYLRGEFIEEQRKVFLGALDEALKHNLIGKNILSSKISIDVHCLLGAGAYIVGEETAMLESIEGKRGMPRTKPPFPAIKGLYGKPTIINNTETLASIPKIMLNKDDWYKDIGLDSSEGMKIFCMSGHVNKPGNYEIPLGTKFSTLLDMAGGVRDEGKLKAVIPGGSSVPVIKGSVMLDLKMDYDSISKAGSMLGSGGVIVMDDSTCMVSVLHRISRFYYEESCGQCTPCREGTGWLHRILTNVLSGHGSVDDLNQLDRIANQIEGHCICALGDAAAMPVRSFLKNFWDEFEFYVDKKKSLVS